MQLTTYVPRHADVVPMHLNYGPIGIVGVHDAPIVIGDAPEVHPRVERRANRIHRHNMRSAMRAYGMNTICPDCYHPAHLFPGRNANGDAIGYTCDHAHRLRQTSDALLCVDCGITITANA